MLNLHILADVIITVFGIWFGSGCIISLFNKNVYCPVYVWCIFLGTISYWIARGLS